MNTDRFILELAAIFTPLLLAAIAGTIHAIRISQSNAIKAAEQSTKIDALWDSWKAEHFELWKEWMRKNGQR